MKPTRRIPIPRRSPARRRGGDRSARDLPGLWAPLASFYQHARENVTPNDDGWSVRTRPPGHRFVAWEMAVRYEAACLEAAFHYTQICDGPDEREFAVRADRIAELDNEAQRLSRIERAVRPMLPGDPRSVGMLASTPHPQPMPPKESRLLPLAVKHLSDVRPQLIEALSMRHQGEEFHPRIYGELVAADRQISGPGMHNAVWIPGRGYWYPFDKEYEAILRPLRYVPAYLNAASRNPVFIRPVVQTAGAHLEGCVKRLISTRAVARNLRRPLGDLLQRAAVKSALGEQLADDMTSFTQLAVNPAKHDYTNDSDQGPVFCYADTVYAYFLARRFGSAALQASSDLDRLRAAVEDSTRQDRYFWGGQLSTGVVQPGGCT